MKLIFKICLKELKNYKHMIVKTKNKLPQFYPQSPRKMSLLSLHLNKSKKENILIKENHLCQKRRTKICQPHHLQIKEKRKNFMMEVYQMK